eukprot:762927-Hanusia_phi.AAC.4
MQLWWWWGRGIQKTSALEPLCLTWISVDGSVLHAIAHARQRRTTRNRSRLDDQEGNQIGSSKGHDNVGSPSRGNQANLLAMQVNRTEYREYVTEHVAHTLEQGRCSVFLQKRNAAQKEPEDDKPSHARSI